MTRHRPVKHITLVGMIMATFVIAGCGADEPAAVCSSVDSLQASIEDVTSVDIAEGALQELRDNLAQVQSDLGTARDDAADEYGDEVDALEQAATSVGSSIEAAITSPSSEALTDVGTAVESLGSSLSVLEDAVSNTC